MTATRSTRNVFGSCCSWSKRGVAVRPEPPGVPALDDGLNFAGMGKCTILDGVGWNFFRKDRHLPGPMC